MLASLGEKLRSREVDSLNPSRRDPEKHGKNICIPSQSLSTHHNSVVNDRITQFASVIV